MGVSRNCRNFSVPPIIPGTDTNFKFCKHILIIDRNKSPLQISGKVAVRVVRTLEIFQGTHILGASRGRLCDSSAFLSIVVIKCNYCCSIRPTIFIWPQGSTYGNTPCPKPRSRTHFDASTQRDSKRTSWQHLSASPNISYDAKCVILP